MKITEIFKKPEKKRDSTGSSLIQQEKLRTQFDLRDFELGFLEAKNRTNPTRVLLNEIYEKDVESDLNVWSQWASRKMKTLERDFKIFNVNSEEENEELKEIFEKPWFYKWMGMALDSQMYGFRLIEFGNPSNGDFPMYWDSNGFLHSGIDIIDPDHVIPERGILRQNVSDIDGKTFWDSEYSKYLMFIGDPYDLGLIAKITPYLLFKKNAIQSWSEFAERFGLPFVAGKTEAQGNARADFIKMMKKMVGGSIGVFDTDDSFEFISTGASDAYQVFHNLIDYVDGQVSKIIFGQDVLSDMTGQTRGTAAENIADMYGEADAKLIKYLVNTQLKSKLNQLGLISTDYKFDWAERESIGLKEKAEIDKMITEMGFQHNSEYINDTYGVNVEQKETPEFSEPDQVAENLKNMYKGNG